MDDVVNGTVSSGSLISVRLRMANDMDDSDDGPARRGSRFGERRQSNEDQISDWLNGKGGGFMLLMLLGIGATLIWNSIFR
ncbi:hypothetical protein [Phytoactinopolyspora mesophila]|uniref:Uncharacterized protein n=1 Tax=Phytoactinopolyspora mesophila TaxID=2650750 RepID=A0A7K3MA80_9ACTN|nr:hypothetical protein [Phytoactinopolyspora mesophila]NDL60241.1 hypothetical protein [Phytoactinopolyspora mesophila]